MECARHRSSLTQDMKTVVGFFLAVIAVAALSAYCTLHWTNKRIAAQNDPHQWLHSQFDLTEKQHEALEPIESRFAVDYAEACTKMNEARHELAQAIGKGNANSPEVVVAVHKIHERMGALQILSIRHIFDMREVLSKEQGDKLLHLAQENLEETI